MGVYPKNSTQSTNITWVSRIVLTYPIDIESQSIIPAGPRSKIDIKLQRIKQ